MKQKLIFLLSLLLLLSSCGATDSTISVAEGSDAQPNTENAESILYVNVSAKKIHFKPDCRHLKQSSAKNISRVGYTDDALQSLLAMEYAPCDNCRFPDYLT